MQSRRPIEHWNIPHVRYVCELERKLLHFCNINHTHTIFIVKLPTTVTGNVWPKKLEVHKQQIKKMSTEKSGEKKKKSYTHSNI